MHSPVAFINGGSRGLGRAIALALVQDGYTICFSYKNQEEEAQKTIRLIEEHGGTGYGYVCDTVEYDQCRKVAEQIRSQYGIPHVLINNAAFTIGAALHDLEIGEWKAILENNLSGYYYWVRIFAPQFMEQKNGVIINISSVNAARGREGHIAYNTSKAGIEGLTRTAARELGAFNIRVNAVAPGFINTEAQRRTPEIIKNLIKHEIALGRLAEPEDIAGVVAFLCSDRARFVTGQIIRVDGGQYL